MERKCFRLARVFCAVAAGLSVASVASAAPVQWAVADGGNGHWYEVVVAEGGISWSIAKTAAEEAGGYLAVVTSSAENDFIFDLADPIAAAWDSSGINTLGPWLGGYQDPDHGNAWTWVTGETFSYTNWGTSQPNGNGDFLNIYGYANNHGKTWNDFSSPVPGYVVEIVPEPASLALLSLSALAVLRRRKASSARSEK